MARLRTETAPEITVNDESVVFKAASGATAPLIEFKDSSGTVVGNIAANGVLNVVSVVASNAGTGSTALATKGYVDSVAAGTNWHAAVAYATDAALPTCTYNNGTGGVGATLTASANGALTIDGETVVQGYSVLVKNQANAAHNGIYTITENGDGSTAFILTRRTDSDNSPTGEIAAGDAVYVLLGTANEGQAYVLTTIGSGVDNAIVVGTDNLSYSVFSGTQQTIAGAGLVRNNNSIAVGTANSSRIVINSDDIDLASVAQTNTSGANTTSFISSISVDAYGRVTGKETSSVSFVGYATSADANLTGTPVAPTASPGSNSTQIATTAFVTSAAAAAEGNSVAKAIFAAKGDILVATANDTPAILALGTDGYFLKANSSKSEGMEWASIPTINDIDDVGGVTITNVASGDFLKHNGSAWVNDAINLGTDTVGNYMSNVAGGTGVSVSHTEGEGSTATVSIGQDVATTANVTFAGATIDAVQVGVTAAGEIDTASGNLTIDSAGGTVTVDDNLVVSGNLTVNGNTTTVNTETLHVSDNIIILNNDVTGSPTENAGVEVERGTSNNVLIRWNETNDKWELTNDGSTYGNVVTTADSGTVTSSMLADVVLNQQTASYTLVLTDKNKIVEISNASATTLTVPADNSVNFPTGAQLTVLQTGAGQVTLTAASGVTINATPGLKLRTQWASATLVKRAANTWVALGDLAA